MAVLVLSGDLPRQEQEQEPGSGQVATPGMCVAPVNR